MAPETSARGVPATINACVAAVCEQLAHRVDLTTGPDQIEQLARQEVERLWGGSITTYVSVLATRLVRERLDERSAARATTLPPGASIHPKALNGHHRERDTIFFDPRDEIIYSDRDTLSNNDDLPHPH